MAKTFLGSPTSHTACCSYHGTYHICERMQDKFLRRPSHQQRVIPVVTVAVLHALNHVWLVATPWNAVHQACLSVTIFQSLLKLISIELVMPCDHLILCRPLLLLPSTFPSIRVISNESALHNRWPKYQSFNLGPNNNKRALVRGGYLFCLLTFNKVLYFPASLCLWALRHRQSIFWFWTQGLWELRLWVASRAGSRGEALSFFCTLHQENDWIPQKHFHTSGPQGRAPALFASEFLVPRVPSSTRGDSVNWNRT